MGGCVMWWHCVSHQWLTAESWLALCGGEMMEGLLVVSGKRMDGLPLSRMADMASNCRKIQTLDFMYIVIGLKPNSEAIRLRI